MPRHFGVECHQQHRIRCNLNTRKMSAHWQKNVMPKTLVPVALYPWRCAVQCVVRCQSNALKNTQSWPRVVELVGKRVSTWRDSGIVVLHIFLIGRLHNNRRPSGNLSLDPFIVKKKIVSFVFSKTEIFFIFFSNYYHWQSVRFELIFLWRFQPTISTHHYEAIMVIIMII